MPQYNACVQMVSQWSNAGSRNSGVGHTTKIYTIERTTANGTTNTREVSEIQELETKAVAEMGAVRNGSGGHNDHGR